jgi:Rrf2 family protein
MKLQTASRLAIYAVLELAGNPDRQLSAAEIGDKYDISTHHLAKVLHTLGRAGLVRSVRGAGGGYTFSGNAKRTTLLDIISLFEPADAMQMTATEPGEHTSEGIALRNVLTEIDEITQATLNSITVSTLLKQAASKALTT